MHLYAGKASLTAELFEHIVRRTENVSAAFIKELMRRATQFQLERELESDAATQMTMGDINNALDELLFSGGTLNRKLQGGDAEPRGE